MMKCIEKQMKYIKYVEKNCEKRGQNAHQN